MHPNPRGAPPPKHAVFVDDSGRRVRRAQRIYRGFAALGVTGCAALIVSLVGGVPLPGLVGPVHLPSGEPAHARGGLGDVAGHADPIESRSASPVGAISSSGGPGAASSAGSPAGRTAGPSHPALPSAAGSHPASAASSAVTSPSRPGHPSRTTGTTPTPGRRTTPVPSSTHPTGRPTSPGTPRHTPTPGRHTTPPTSQHTAPAGGRHTTPPGSGKTTPATGRHTTPVPRPKLPTPAPTSSTL